VLQLNASAMGESELMQLLRDKDGALHAMTESARALERAVAEAKVELHTLCTTVLLLYMLHLAIVSRRQYNPCNVPVQRST
jgi:hypothetical protein